MNKLTKSISAIFLAVFLLLSTTVISYACDDRDPRGIQVINPYQTVIKK